MATPISVRELTRAGRGMPRWLIPLALLALLVVAAGYVVYRIWFRQEATPAATLQTATVTRGQLATTLSASGSAYAALQSKLTFNASGATTVTGLVKSVDVRLGQEVVAGEQLATLDPRNVSRALQQAETNLESARQRLDQLIASEPADRASAAQAVVSARSQLAKAQDALADLRDGASVGDLASARQAAFAAENALAAAQKTLDEEQYRVGTNAQIQGLQQRLDGMHAQLSGAQAALTAQFADPLESTTVRVATDALLDEIDRRCRAVGSGERCLEVATSAASLGDLVAGLRALDATRDLVQLHAAFVTAAQPRDASVQGTVLRAAQALASVHGLRERSNALLLTISNYGTPTADELLSATRAREAAAAALTSARERLRVLQEGATSEELRNAEDAVSSAQLTLETALARQATTGTSGDVTLQQMQVQLAEVALQQARDAMDDTVLKAPFNGIVGAISISPGDLAGPSTQAITLTDPTAIGVQVTISETDLPGLSVGQLGTARFTALSQQTYVIQILGVGNVPTITSGVVTYPVQATILRGAALEAQSERLQELLSSSAGSALRSLAGVRGPGTTTPLTADQLRELISQLSAQRLPAPGMNGSVTILQRITNEALLIPTSAVRRQGTQSFVFIQGAAGAPEQRAITVGGSDGTNSEVTSGLAEGDTVLIGSITLAATGTATAASTGTNSGPPAGAPGGSQMPGGVR